MSLQEYYNSFASEVASGNLCAGPSCGGWFLSDVDTWHNCGCGKNANRHPEDSLFEEPTVLTTAEMRAIEIKRLASYVGQFMVQVKMASGWHATCICKHFAGAAACVRSNLPIERAPQRVKRISTPEEARQAEFQMEDMREWFER